MHDFSFVFLSRLHSLAYLLIWLSDTFSWGTKGEDVARPPSKDLGDVSGSGHEVDVELPADQGEIDAFYDEALSSIKQCKYPDKVATPSRKAAPSAKQRLEIEKDYCESCLEDCCKLFQADASTSQTPLSGLMSFCECSFE